VKVTSTVLISVLSAGTLGCAADRAPSGLNFQFAPPTESDAIPMSTKYHSKAEVLSGLGTPKSKAVLVPSGISRCVERWFYIGKVDVGLGPIDMMTYVDFDDAEAVCKPSAST
jgi:hypothetical protein